MNVRSWGLLGAGLLIATESAITVAQAPTLLMKAAAINGRRLDQGPVGRVDVAPGDLLTVEVYVRDWSPHDEQLAGYQAEIDLGSFSSGTRGTVEPIGYQKSLEENKPDKTSTSVDLDNEHYVYKGMPALDMSGSLGSGYRVAGVIVGKDGPISQQDGTQFYIGTIEFQVSDDAAGTFELAFDHTVNKSILVNQVPEPIASLVAQSLVVEVCPPTSGIDLAKRIDAMVQGRAAQSGDEAGGTRDEKTALLRSIAALNATRLSRDTKAQREAQSPNSQGKTDVMSGKDESA